MQEILDNLNKAREVAINNEYNKALEDLRYATINNPLSSEYNVYSSSDNKDVIDEIIRRFAEDGVNARASLNMYMDTMGNKMFYIRVTIPLKFASRTIKEKEESIPVSTTNEENPLCIDFNLSKETKTLELRITNTSTILSVVHLLLDFACELEPNTSIPYFYTIAPRQLSLKPTADIKCGQSIRFQVKILGIFSHEECERLCLGNPIKQFLIKYSYRLTIGSSVFGESPKSGAITVSL